MDNNAPTHHPEEISDAERENRPVRVTRLFRYDHINHKIPLGTLVEVDIKINEEERVSATLKSEVCLTGRCKLFVVQQFRDCDGTPLYGLSLANVSPPEGSDMQAKMLYETFTRFYKHGYNEESLKPIGFHLPPLSWQAYLQRLRG